MRKWQPWIKKGAKVMAGGKPGTITKFETNGMHGDDCNVFYIYVQLDGGKHANPYHPNDVEPIMENAA